MYMYISIMYTSILCPWCLQYSILNETAANNWNTTAELDRWSRNVKTKYYCLFLRKIRY